VAGEADGAGCRVERFQPAGFVSGIERGGGGAGGLVSRAGGEFCGGGWGGGGAGGGRVCEEVEGGVEAWVFEEGGQGEVG